MYEVIVRNERLNSLDWTRVCKHLKAIGFTPYGSGIWGKPCELEPEADECAAMVKNLLRDHDFAKALEQGDLRITKVPLA